jgi:RNA polymerase sigma factor (sigma-70 family)
LGWLAGEPGTVPGRSDRRRSPHGRAAISDRHQAQCLRLPEGRLHQRGIRRAGEVAILPIDAAIQSNLRETTTRVLASVTPREERVLRTRFGIGMNKDHTLEEVGRQFSVTRERIRQIEAKALRKLKHPNRSRILRSFLHD